jgi:hypothetical protein
MTATAQQVLHQQTTVSVQSIHPWCPLSAFVPLALSALMTYQSLLDGAAIHVVLITIVLLVSRPPVLLNPRRLCTLLLPLTVSAATDSLCAAAYVLCVDMGRILLEVLRGLAQHVRLPVIPLPLDHQMHPCAFARLDTLDM